MIEKNEDREGDVRERIASLIQAIERTPTTRVTDEELRKLRAAASHLDQMLKAAADADALILKSAAARLDQLLANISTGKDVSADLKRRQNGQARADSDHGAQHARPETNE
jgi:methylphosphotriester-DNA--protein-cysteine methyltransferase